MINNDDEYAWPPPLKSPQPPLVKPPQPQPLKSPQFPPVKSPVPAPSLSPNVPYATNPGGVEIDLFIHNLCYLDFIAALVFLLPGIALLLMGALRSWIWLIPGALLTAFGIFVGWRLTFVARRRLMKGDTCPAKVLNPDLGLIAVLADMSLSLNDPYPAIKILDAPLSRSPSRPFKENDRLTTVCGFRGSLEGDHWKDFEPIVVVCATADKATIDRSLASISADDWMRLDRAIELLPSREPGLYFLNEVDVGT
jgi:hypothetical protein